MIPLVPAHVHQLKCFGLIREHPRHIVGSATFEHSQLLLTQRIIGIGRISFVHDAGQLPADPGISVGHVRSFTPILGEVVEFEVGGGRTFWKLWIRGVPAFERGEPYQLPGISANRPTKAAVAVVALPVERADIEMLALAAQHRPHTLAVDCIGKVRRGCGDISESRHGIGKIPRFVRGRLRRSSTRTGDNHGDANTPFVQKRLALTETAVDWLLSGKLAEVGVVPLGIVSPAVAGNNKSHRRLD